MRRRVFREPSICYTRDFILDNKISESDSIALSGPMFDELALDLRKTYNEPMPTPLVFLGIWIKIAERSTVRYNEAIIRKNDAPQSEPDMAEIAKRQMNGKMYKCGYCGRLIDEYGDGLIGEAFENAKEN